MKKSQIKKFGATPTIDGVLAVFETEGNRVKFNDLVEYLEEMHEEEIDIMALDSIIDNNNTPTSEHDWYFETFGEDIVLRNSPYNASTKKSIPTWNKIEKRCPNGYHKDPKTGQCVDANGNIAQARQEQPKQEKKPKKTKEEKVKDFFKEMELDDEEYPYILGGSYHGIPKGTPAIRNRETDDIYLFYNDKWRKVKQEEIYKVREKLGGVPDYDYKNRKFTDAEENEKDADKILDELFPAKTKEDEDADEKYINEVEPEVFKDFQKQIKRLGKGISEGKLKADGIERDDMYIGVYNIMFKPMSQREAESDYREDEFNKILERLEGLKGFNVKRVNWRDNDDGTVTYFIPVEDAEYWKDAEKSARKMKKGHGNYYDAIENFIVDNGEVGPYYNDIYDEFIDVLTEDDIMDAIEYLINEGTICYNENNERFEICAKGVRKMKKSDDDEIICPYCGEVARPSRDPAGAYVAYCNHCDRPLEEDELATYDDIGRSAKKQYVPDMPSFRDMTNKMRNTRTYRIGD